MLRHCGRRSGGPDRLAPGFLQRRMSEILFQYEKINPATWVYLSSLLMLGLFFQFNRFWSVRNLDLVLLILLAPGLLMVNEAREGVERRQREKPAVVAREAASPVVTTDATAVATSLATSPPLATASAVPLAGDSDLLSRRSIAYAGYFWLLVVSLIWLVRMLVDPTMIRRPLLEPNATKG